MYLKKKQNLFILELFLFFIYAILIILGIKEFSIWQQITYYLSNDFNGNNETLLSLFETNHPHFLRIFILYVIYQISLFFALDITFIYNLLLLFLLFFTYIFIKKIIFDIFNFIDYKILGVLFFYFLLSFFMNGRIIFAIFGNTLLLYGLYFNIYSINQKITNFKLVIIVIFSLLITSVSSGTFMVCLLTIFLFYFFIIVVRFPFLEKKIIYMIFFIFIIISSIIPLITQFINKNLDFYDGSILKMLEHGFGKYLEAYVYIVLPLLLFLPFIFIIGYYFLSKNHKLILSFSLILSSLFIGLFGFSSLFSGISGFVLLIINNLYNVKKADYCQKKY